ncbi:hypothetical protein [Lysinibacillus sp. NPDC047702]|uniref:hypothetical protein n=1 Tax=unclassified Lysinibacillus TaxID=2636778 RepID=UPI003D0193B4
MNIEVSLQDSKLKAENIQDFHMSDIIKGFFLTLNSLDGNNNNSINKSPIKKIDFKQPVSKNENTQSNEKMTTVTKLSSKILPKINDERTLNTPIAELIQQPEEHWVTGIKVEDDGTNRYRAYYWCECGSKGKRYVNEKDEIVNCRDCGQEMVLEAATLNYQENGLPERDSFGNFFIAREMVNTN